MEEMRAIIGNADLRGKALTLTFSSVIREGAIESLKIQDVSPVVRDGRVEGRNLRHNTSPY